MRHGVLEEGAQLLSLVLELLGQAGRVGPRRDAELDGSARAGGRAGEKLEDVGDVGVKGVLLAVAVGGEGVRAVWLEGRRDVRVYPEWPEGVVEVEDDEFGEGPAVGEEVRYSGEVGVGR